MSRPDKIEFHLGNRVLLEVESSFAPDRGDRVCVAKKVYPVVGRSYVIDYAFDGPALQQVCCVIDLGEPERSL